MAVKLLFEGDDQALETMLGLLSDVPSNLEEEEEEGEEEGREVASDVLQSGGVSHTLLMLVLSRAASISSSTKKGAG